MRAQLCRLLEKAIVISIRKSGKLRRLNLTKRKDYFVTDESIGTNRVNATLKVKAEKQLKNLLSPEASRNNGYRNESILCKRGF